MNQDLAWGKLVGQMRLARLMGLRVQLAIEEEERDVPTWYVSVVDTRRAHGTMPVSGEYLRAETLEALALGLEHAIKFYRDAFQGIRAG